MLVRSCSPAFLTCPQHSIPGLNTDSGDEDSNSDGGYNTEAEKQAGLKRKRGVDDNHEAHGPAKRTPSVNSTRQAPHQMSPDSKLASFHRRILALSPSTLFDPANQRRIACGGCRSWIKCHEGRVDRMKLHLKSCKAKSRTNTIQAAFAKVRLTTQSVLPTPVLRPYVGLRGSALPAITSYLERASAPGGGAPQRDILAQRRFHQAWATLRADQINELRAEEIQRYVWRNFHGRGIVYSTKCRR